MTNTNFDALVGELVALEADIQPALDRINTIKAELRTALDLGKYEFANQTVTLSASRRLDKKAFEARYPVEQHPEFYKRDVDSAAIKKALAPAEIEELSTFGEPRLVIK